MIAWDREHYQRMSIGDLLRKFEALKEQDEPFDPDYPIIHLQPVQNGYPSVDGDTELPPPFFENWRESSFLSSGFCTLGHVSLGGLRLQKPGFGCDGPNSRGRCVTCLGLAPVMTSWNTRTSNSGLSELMMGRCARFFTIPKTSSRPKESPSWDEPTTKDCSPVKSQSSLHETGPVVAATRVRPEFRWEVLSSPTPRYRRTFRACAAFSLSSSAAGSSCGILPRL